MKVTVQDFFQTFYDTMIFHPVIGGLDVQFVKWSFFDTAYDSIVKIDKLFSSVDKNAFRQEMMALRMELIGLSFYFHNSKKDELLLAQSVFTKNYLRDNGSLEIWDTMLVYNKVISESSGSYIEGNRPLYRVHVAMHNGIMYDKWIKFFKAHETDETALECAARICNRYACEVAWKKQFTQRYLMSKLAERVNCNNEINPDALMGIISTFMMFYGGANKAIKSASFE